MISSLEDVAAMEFGPRRNRRGLSGLAAATPVFKGGGLVQPVDADLPVFKGGGIVQPADSAFPVFKGGGIVQPEGADLPVFKGGGIVQPADSAFPVFKGWWYCSSGRCNLAGIRKGWVALCRLRRLRPHLHPQPSPCSTLALARQPCSFSRPNSFSRSLPTRSRTGAAKTTAVSAVQAALKAGGGGSITDQSAYQGVPGTYPAMSTGSASVSQKRSSILPVYEGVGVGPIGPMLSPLNPDTGEQMTFKKIVSALPQLPLPGL